MYFRVFFLIFSLLNSYALLFSQSTDFIKGNINISINPFKKSVQGQVSYTFKSTEDSIYLDAQNMKILSILMDNLPVKSFQYNSKEIQLKNPFKDNNQHLLSINYEAHPKKAMYFMGWKKQKNAQIWTQGQGKNNSHWVPCIDNYKEKVIFDTEVVFDKNYNVIANGILKNVLEKDSLKIWKYEMCSPMSSYLLALVIGKYDKDSLKSSSEVPLEFYFYPKDIFKVEPTYRHSIEIFNFLEKEIGIPFPWEIYKQIPVKDFIHGGMENTTLTIFPDEFVVDSIGFYDQNYISINAHELAHQWFGNLVTQKNPEDHWLQEGFATYYGLLSEKKLYGKKHFYSLLYDIFLKLQKEKSEPIISTKASSFTYYQRAAFTLHILRKKVGKKMFKVIVKKYLDTYKFGNASSIDFFNIAESVSRIKLSDFKEEWLKKSVPKDKYLEEVKTFPFYNTMERYSEKLRQNNFSFNKKKNIISKAFFSKIITQISDEGQKQLLVSALKTNDTKLHHIALNNIDSVTAEIKPYFEKILSEDSYISKGLALEKLCKSFPSQTHKYLKVNENLLSKTAVNHRLIWLYYAIKHHFKTGRTNQYIEELELYSSSEYGYGVRYLSFSILFSLKIISQKIIINILEACVHHKYEFRIFARGLFEGISERVEEEVKNIKDDLSKEAKVFISKKYSHL